MREVGTGQVTKTVVDRVAQLTAQETSPEPRLARVCGHGFIEPGLHYRREATRREDRSHVRRGYAVQGLAAPITWGLASGSGGPSKSCATSARGSLGTVIHARRMPSNDLARSRVATSAIDEHMPG